MNPVDSALQATERLQKTRELLLEKGSLFVKDLSELLSVSENTIRRDLSILEDEGICIRTKGGASLIKTTGLLSPFALRSVLNSTSKKEIAREACRLIHNGMTILLDSGTTSIALAEQLLHHSHISVLSNSLAVANILCRNSEITLVLAGGLLHPPSLSLTGKPAEDFFSSYHADIYFLSPKAVSLEHGISEHTIQEASVKKAMLEAADQVVVLADATKLEQRALCPLCTLDTVDMLISDTTADEQVLTRFINSGILVQRINS